MHGHTTGPSFFFAENIVTTAIYVNMLEYNFYYQLMHLLIKNTFTVHI